MLYFNLSLSTSPYTNKASEGQFALYDMPDIFFTELKYQRDWLGNPVMNQSLATHLILTIRGDVLGSPHKPTQDIKSSDGSATIATADLAAYKTCLLSGLAQHIQH